MEENVDYLEKEFGIKQKEQDYNILFKLEESRNTIEVKGEILNFCSSQLVLKSTKGLYIIHPRNIIEMRPINKLIK